MSARRLRWLLVLAPLLAGWPLLRAQDSPAPAPPASATPAPTPAPGTPPPADRGTRDQPAPPAPEAKDEPADEQVSADNNLTFPVDI